jgi:hypothetical protein
MSEALLEKEPKIDKQSQPETAEEQQFSTEQREGTIHDDFRGEVTFRAHWQEILPSAAREEVLACMRRDHVSEPFDYLYTSLESDGKMHWHLKIIPEDIERYREEIELWSPHEAGDQPRT